MPGYTVLIDARAESEARQAYLLFRIVGEQVQIAAVMHLRREPGYWKRGE